MDRKRAIEASIAENAKRLSDLDGGDEMSKRVKKRILQKLGKLKKDLAAISNDKPIEIDNSNVKSSVVGVQDGKGAESIVLSKEERKLKLRLLNKDLADFAQKKQLTIAKKRFEQGIRKGIKVDVHTYTNLINAYVRCSDMQGAEQQLKRMISENIQPNLVTYTTLLKGYSEIGDMISASKIFFSGMGTEKGPNVRALNTFLRACVRTGMVKPALQSYFDFVQRKNSTDLVMPALGDNKKRKVQHGAESQATSSSSSSTDNSEYALDASSYEYLIGLLCRAGQLNVAEDILRQFTTNETSALNNRVVSAGGVSAIENTAIYISLAAAETLRGAYSAAQKWADLAVDSLKRTETATLKDSMLKRFQAEDGVGNTVGTKRGAGDAQDDSRSVALFLKHRRTELEGRLESVQDYLNHAASASRSIISSGSSNSSTSLSDSSIAAMKEQASASVSHLQCLSQVLNFGFDGKCDFDMHELTGTAAESVPYLVKSKALLDLEWNESDIVKRLLIALREKYGLDSFHVPPMTSLPAAALKLPSTQQMYSQLSAKIEGTKKAVESKIRCAIHSETGKIVFPALFKPVDYLNGGSVGSKQDITTSSAATALDDLPVKLEVCSGDGEWIVAQAEADWTTVQASTSTGASVERVPRALWVALELRCDRIQHTLAHYILSNPVATLCGAATSSSSSSIIADAAPIHNLALLGGNAAKIIPERVGSESISEIFINHPQPPDRVTGGGDVNSGYNKLHNSKSTAAGAGKSGGSAQEKNQGAHLLTQEFFAQLVRILKPGGAITIVTDNQSYGKSLAASIAALPAQDCQTQQNIHEQIYAAAATPDASYKAVLTGGVDRFSLPSDWDHSLDDSHAVIALPTAASPVSVKQCGCTVDLWRGEPGPEIGHVVQASSYFDRMWDLGQKKRRWFIYVKKAMI
mmetsp:Transcript_38751/g.77175  ORF Transcript_38751/g.77175 Transcript_38751/m.77175 type:complete len:923 (-) Transcript_38751:50-2818(-)